MLMKRRGLPVMTVATLTKRLAPYRGQVLRCIDILDILGRRRDTSATKYGGIIWLVLKHSLVGDLQRHGKALTMRIGAHKISDFQVVWMAHVMEKKELHLELNRAKRRVGWLARPP
jgi:hypothetical protein